MESRMSMWSSLSNWRERQRKAALLIRGRLFFISDTDFCTKAFKYYRLKPLELNLKTVKRSQKVEGVKRFV